MIRALIFPLLSAVLCGVLALGILFSGASGYFDGVSGWRSEARQSPEGIRAEVLFDAAVAEKAISWNPDQRLFELQRKPSLSEELATSLFDIGEEGAVIRMALDRANSLSSYIAVRARRPECPQPCEHKVQWSAFVGPSKADRMSQLALGAASIDGPVGIPEPLPTLHFRLWEAAGANYSDWIAWRANGRLTVELDDASIDQADIVGRVDETAISAGWQVTQRWCRDKTMLLSECPALEFVVADAYRVTRVDGAATGPLRFDVSPLSLFPALGYEGALQLTEYISLVCSVDKGCSPAWIPNPIERRYSVLPRVPILEAMPDGTPTEVPKLIAPWAEVLIDANGTFLGFAASKATVEIGAGSLVGNVRGPRGSILHAVEELSDEPNGAAVTLDAKIQTVLYRVFDAMTHPERLGSSEIVRQLDYRFPPGAIQASMVLLDLRKGDNQGAILAAVGSPEAQLDLSRWDYRAAAADPSSSIPPGPAAWTGRGSHHVPGSAWKMVTALALIESVTDTTLPVTARSQMKQILLGLDREESDRILGDHVLYGYGGLCVPFEIAKGMIGTDVRKPGTDLRECPEGYFGRAIRDSGRGGPLLISERPDFTFGLASAMQRSSNIWFAATLLHVERLRLELEGSVSDAELGDGFERTLANLGLDQPLLLDGGRGLSMLPRDAVSVEAFREESASVRALASAAFGQQVQAGPLILAQVAGSIRTGLSIQPSLIAPVPPHPPLMRGGLESETLLDELRLGMRRVVQRNGTGFLAFARNAPTARTELRVGGKTGTAVRRLGSDERLSTFAGWLDDTEGKPRFAIGCSAGVQGVPSNGGVLAAPAVCAYAVAAVMRELEAADLVDP